MDEGRRAAFDEIAEQPLNKVTVQQFLDALNASELSVRSLVFWPEKKKVELFVEPENQGNVKVGDLIAKLRAEKKKVELEVEPVTGGGTTIIWGSEKKKRELELPPEAGPGGRPIPMVPEKKKVELEPAPFDVRGALSEEGMNTLLAALEARVIQRLQEQGVIKP